ncbi:ribonuclease HII [Natronospira proteinivora]|uniref:Ribonuclease HII n=1 Tax=Natronospira proteinivora TaxID=1807133 RepID=A0ABT1G5T2_9GAMM|nr:ribonuclease HII [Natronospira proteinivora]MCP1726631.1 ribonuclease HII [Natronospira proteinivora]
MSASQAQLGLDWMDGCRVCGVDEVGRGPLAGPVVAAAVILDPGRPITGLADSKKLTPRRRDSLDALIRERAMAYAIASIPAEGIDELNILQASLQAMSDAVAALEPAAQAARVDGDRLPRLSIPGEAVVGGDARVPEIAAASIIAKVARDRWMEAAHKRYPEYGFAGHKGYPTKAHMAALAIHGPCDIHRRSFAPVRRFYDEVSG